MDAAAELGSNPVSKHQIQPEYGDEQADAGRDGWTRLARPNSRARTGTGEYSFSLFSWPRAGLATLPGWSILYMSWPYIHTYIHSNCMLWQFRHCFALNVGLWFRCHAFRHKRHLYNRWELIKVSTGRSTPVAQLAPRNLLTRWDVSSIPANGIFLTKN